MINSEVWYKTTVWRKAIFSCSADMQDIVDLIKEGDFGEIFDTSLGFIEDDIEYTTEEILTPEENNYLPTIEVWEEGEIIYENYEI